MLIQCTKKLLDELKINPSEEIEENPLFSWHANIITINRRKVLVLVNDSSRYTIVIYGLTAKEKKNIVAVISDSIKTMFAADYIKTEVTQEYLDASPGFTFTKTKDRRTVARLNEACHIVKDDSDIIEPDNLYQLELNKVVNTFPYIMNNNLFQPNKVLYEALENYYKKKIIQCKAIKLKVALKMKSHTIWHRLVIPYDITFAQLNNIIQKSFNWHNYHLYDFTIFNKKQVVAHVVSKYESAEYIKEGDISSKECKISEYLPKYKKLVYRYDYGDNWVHTIDVEDFLFDYDKNHPVCLNGEGTAPPEDVGGEFGYNEFLRILSNTENESYHEIKHWATMQNYNIFDIENLNRWLEKVLIKSFYYL